MNRVQETLMKFVESASYVLHEYFQMTSIYFDKHSEISPYHTYVLKQLPISCQLTSESSLILVGNVRIWDNEMLIRSIMEGTVKFIYLTLGSNEERDRKIIEFWDVLPEISQIKRSKRAKVLLDILGEPLTNYMDFIKGVILDEKTIEELERKYPRKIRKQLEHKWSYSEIVKELLQYPLYNNIQGLFHSYGIGSQLIHQDADALNVIIDHYKRVTDRREAKELAHGCRQISDILTFAAMRYFAFTKLYNENIDKVFIDSFTELKLEMDDYHKLFRDIEDKHPYTEP